MLFFNESDTVTAATAVKHLQLMKHDCNSIPGYVIDILITSLRKAQKCCSLTNVKFIHADIEAKLEDDSSDCMGFFQLLFGIHFYFS